jgi:PAS domain S-box-containing protein
MSAFDRQELVQTLFEESGDALFLFDPDTEQLLDVNPMVQRLSGFARQELLKMPISFLFRSETPGRLNRLRQAFHKTGVFHSQEDFLLRTNRDGAWISVNLTITRLHVRPRKLGLIAARDIRERQEAHRRQMKTEAELHRVLASVSASEARYRSLTENLEQCIFLKDAELRFVAANSRFCELLGRTEAELIGMTDWDFFPPERASRYQADDRRILADGKRLELEEQFPLGDMLRTVRVVKTPVKDDLGQTVGVHGIFWDVTEQRTLEAQLRQAQKMEAVGQLAGGVAHDFNNLLTVILGNVQLLQTVLPPGHPQRSCLEATEKAALRAADLTRKMLGFSRRTSLSLVPVDLRAEIDETVALLERTIDPRISLEVEHAPGLWLVEADPGQINQVLMNLCLNARDAMPEGGTLRLSAENVVLDHDAVRWQLEARTGEFVRLRIEDTGSGIAPEVLPRIFEPFFTTKEAGKGTGLGLAMVFGIVKQHQGWIDCSSEVGAGARFDIHFPRFHLKSEIGTEAKRARAVPSPRHGHETILLVDDEAMIRNLGRTILQGHGYQVLLAEDGQEAVETYRREKGRIDLVVMDLMMPRLSGPDALRQLLRMDPEVRVILASGYAAEHVTGPEGNRVLGFLAKPYSPEQLAQAVRAALDRHHLQAAARSPIADSAVRQDLVCPQI